MTFVRAIVKKDEVSRRTVQSTSTEVKKQLSFRYFLRGANGTQKKVCRHFFVDDRTEKVVCKELDDDRDPEQNSKDHNADVPIR